MISGHWSACWTTGATASSRSTQTFSSNGGLSTKEQNYLTSCHSLGIIARVVVSEISEVHGNPRQKGIFILQRVKLNSLLSILKGVVGAKMNEVCSLCQMPVRGESQKTNKHHHKHNFHKKIWLYLKLIVTNQQFL